MLASRLCVRAAVRPSLTGSLSNIPVAAAAWRSRRVFATTPQHRKEDVARIQTLEKEKQARQPAEESVKPETVKKEPSAQPAVVNTDPLLAEQTVSNKQQRKADWAIIRDMAHYLWPKDDFGTRFRVGLSVGLLIGAKVRKLSSLSQCLSCVDRLCRSSMSKSHSTSNRSSTA